MSQQQRNALPIGEKLQNYRIEGILGSGGFGITYMGVESVTERKVAIKEFMPSNIAVRDRDSRSIQPISESERSDFDWGLDRFRQEAKVLITLIHPNIVPVLNYFEANGTGYLVMAYQEGDSLAALLRPNKTLAQSEIEEILVPTLDGLATIHDAGFLHRDIKPDNIFIRSDGTPVIIDFGSARLALSQHTRGLTAIVSEGYAPFEQYQNDGNQGPWSDIYALGATLYRCITGRRPAEATARIAAAVKGSPDPLIPTGELAGPGYNAALLTAIDASLAVDESKRPQNAAAMRAMLSGEIIPEAAGATLLAGATPSSETMLVGGAATTSAAAPVAAQSPAPDNTLQPDAGFGVASGATITGSGRSDDAAIASSATATTPVRSSKRSRKLLWPALAAGVLLAGGASAYVAIEKPWEPEQVAAIKTEKDPLKTVDPTDAESKRKAEEEKRRAEEAKREAAKREAARKTETGDDQARKEAARKAEEARRQAADAEARRKAEAARKQAADAEARRKAAEAETQRKTAEAEAQRKTAEAEARKRADEEARKKAAEAEARRKATAEAERQANEAETRRKTAEAEAQRQAELRRQAVDTELRRKAAIEARRKAAAEAARRKVADEARKRAQDAQRKAALAEARRKAAIDAARKKALEAQKRKSYAERAETRRKAQEARKKRLEAARKAAAERRKKQLAARNTGGIAKYLPGRRVSYIIQSGRGEEEWRMTISFSAGGGAHLSCSYQDLFGRYGACYGYIEGRARWTARGNSVCVRFRGGKQHCFGAVKRGARWSLIPRVRNARLRSFR